MKCLALKGVSHHRPIHLNLMILRGKDVSFQRILYFLML